MAVNGNPCTGALQVAGGLTGGGGCSWPKVGTANSMTLAKTTIQTVKKEERIVDMTKILKKVTDSGTGSVYSRGGGVWFPMSNERKMQKTFMSGA